ncbi:MAG: hypothetical protein M5R36_08200 [Deltaproteobacteria bacterium]|nr:hypothetical protein [Deltaproteobacteria bacterium]
MPHGGALDLADVAGPIQQTTDPVQCHLQTEIDSIWGIPLRIYAHWIDGRDDEDSGRPDYPVMGNAGANGTAHVFLIQEPHGGRTGDKLPAVFTLHGSGMGSYTSWTTPAVNLLFDLDGRLDGAFLVGLDDVLMMNTVGQLGEPPFPHMVQTRWLGYWRGYDRFTPPTEPPPDDAVVINYTIRRVDFLIDWILAHEEVDEHRLSLVGISGGGGGVGFMARWAPEKFAAGISFVPPLIGSPFDEATYLMGSFDQNLATNLPGGIGVRDWYRLSTRIRDEDTPFLRFVIGTQDSFGTWPEQIEFWNEFDAMRFGAHLYWDGRGHISDWRPQHWTGSEKHQPRSLTRFRNDQSFPAFSAADERPDLDSRMPDPLIDPWGRGAVTWIGKPRRSRTPPTNGRRRFFSRARRRLRPMFPISTSKNGSLHPASAAFQTGAGRRAPVESGPGRRRICGSGRRADRGRGRSGDHRESFRRQNAAARNDLGAGYRARRRRFGRPRQERRRRRRRR